MNRKQKKVLIITLFIFAALCVTVPKQKYVGHNEGTISLDSQLYKETVKDNSIASDRLTAMLVKTHYDYNYLITWSLCLCGLSGILLLYFKDKKQQTETQK
ncbi:MAG: hypothetical protein LBE11_00105, partial [Prevotellaceae bacterium]|nr:hypothetical protein [Prevotellaceae bacterium]